MVKMLFAPRFSVVVFSYAIFVALEFVDAQLVPDALYSRGCIGSRGQFPHEAYCHKYYNCWDGRATVEDCPGELLFNAVTSTCDYPEAVSCGGRIRNLAPFIAGGTCLKQWGTFPDPTDCTAFYECDHGIAFRKVCPFYTAFDERVLVCVHAHEVDCAGRGGVYGTLAPPIYPLPDSSSRIRIQDDRNRVGTSGTGSFVRRPGSSTSSSVDWDRRQPQQGPPYPGRSGSGSAIDSGRGSLPAGSEATGVIGSDSPIGGQGGYPGFGPGSAGSLGAGSRRPPGFDTGSSLPTGTIGSPGSVGSIAGVGSPGSVGPISSVGSPRIPTGGTAGYPGPREPDSFGPSGSRTGTSGSPVSIGSAGTTRVTGSDGRSPVSRIPGGDSRSPPPTRISGSDSRSPVSRIPGSDIRSPVSRVPGSDVRPPPSRVPGSDGRSPISRIPGGESRPPSSRIPGGDGRAPGSRIPGADGRGQGPRLPGSDGRGQGPRLPGSDSLTPGSRIPGSDGRTPSSGVSPSDGRFPVTGIVGSDGQTPGTGIAPSDGRFPVSVVPGSDGRSPGSGITGTDGRFPSSVSTGTDDRSPTASDGRTPLSRLPGSGAPSTGTRVTGSGVSPSSRVPGSVGTSVSRVPGGIGSAPRTPGGVGSASRTPGGGESPAGVAGISRDSSISAGITGIVDKDSAATGPEKQYERPLSTDATFRCPHPRGLYAFALDCTKFWLCREYRPSLLKCPMGQLFDLASLTCTQPEKAQCSSLSPRS